MRHIDGIKPIKKQAPNERGNFSQTTGHEFLVDENKLALPMGRPKPKRSRKTFQINRKSLCLILMMFFLVVIGHFAFTRSQTRSEALRQELTGKIVVINEKISTIQDEINDGNVQQASGDIAALKADIVDLKMFAQSWGQDIKYFQNLAISSDLTKREKLLDSAYESILLIEALPTDLKKLEDFTYLGQGDYIADVKGFRIELAKLTEKLDKFSSRIRNNLTGVSYANSLMPKINLLTDKVNYLKTISNNYLYWLSGEDGQDKNILIIFQNNRELRGGSGGSFGSFGIARIRDGKIKKIDFGTNIYKLDSAFKQKEHIPPPTELDIFGGDWTLKQSGFAVDGQEALDKIRWFYEKETGERVDGAVSIDSSTITDLLNIIGPIEMPSYSKTLTADNFVDETMQEVQNDYFERDGGKTENEPKKIIGDMTPIFMSRLFDAMNNKEKSFAVLNSLKQSFEQKHILLNFAKEDLQKELVNLNIAGTVNRKSGDYLYINNSNIGGAKSNQSMVENIFLSTEITKEGEVRDQLSIERVHTGQAKALDGRDQNYIRSLVPLGSEILSFIPTKGNFERYHDRGYRNGEPFWVDKEAGKSTINFWMSTLPGQNTKADIAYKPNYKINIGNEFIYVINFQRQPGAPADNVELTLAYPTGYSPVNIENLDQLGHTLKLKFKLDTDKEIKIKFEKNLVGSE